MSSQRSSQRRIQELFSKRYAGCPGTGCLHGSLIKAYPRSGHARLLAARIAIADGGLSP